MVKITKKIKDLFYNPEIDSIVDVLEDIKKTHTKILKSTDLTKATIPFRTQDYKSAIEDFKIPNTGISKKDVAKTVSSLFHGVSRWHSPRVMYNVAPPPLLSTVVTKTFTSLYNPNLVLDTASGESILTEQKVIKAIAEYVGWKWTEAGGTFTFGGKATTMYGIKLGLKKCSPNSSTEGIKENIIVLSTKSGHPSHISDAEWLGIGTKNVIRLNIDVNSRIDLEDMKNVMETKIKEGKKIATIIISGGTTNNMVVDPIKNVVKLRNEIVQKFELDYIPHIHVDSVVGFPWIFFKDYNFKINNLNIDQKALKKISIIAKDLKYLYMADSFGIDFHKMGFCPYISSLFMVKDKSVFNGQKEDFFTHGQNSPFTYSIENSRSGDGPNSAYVALSTLGVRGFQILIAHLTETAIDLQNKLKETGLFEMINEAGLGSSIMFAPHLPKNICFNTKEEEITTRNLYSINFIEKIFELGNPYYIDKVPPNSTGAKPYPCVALKAYIISPYSSKKSNTDFVVFVTQLKKEIDSYFNFKNQNMFDKKTDFKHPLK